MAKEKISAHLSIFLVKQDISNIGSIIKEEQCSKHINVAISGYGNATLYVKRGSSQHPKWSSIFSDVMDISLIGGTSNVSAAFVLNVSDRYFVLTFGPGGRFLIKDDVCEERFGLLVALNSVDKESFRCIDKQSLDSIESHSRIQSGHETSPDQFGLDVEQDMLKAIVGAPKEFALGNRMTGTDSLSVAVRMNLSDLPSLLNSYKNKYEKDLSTTDYQWVNNISVVKNKSSLIEDLNGKLLTKFEAKNYSNLWLSIPQIINWDSVKGFMFSCGKDILHPDINLEAFLTTIKNGQVITIELLKNRKVFCADEEHNRVYGSWSVYKCLYAEIDLHGSKYILNDSKWFKVAQDFVAKTNEDFDNIELSSLVLPKYFGGSEGEYNTNTAKNNPEQFALLDDKNKIFHGGGHGQVEVCDLFSKDKQLIHVKRYGKSSVLSHLFSQGFVSGQLIQLDSEFRKKFKDKVPDSFKSLVSVDKRPEENEFTIIYAVISDSVGDDLYLPFFSRVNLNNTYKTLKGFGYKVEVLKIKVDDIYSKTKKCPPAKPKQL